MGAVSPGASSTPAPPPDSVVSPGLGIQSSGPVTFSDNLLFPLESQL